MEINKKISNFEEIILIPSNISRDINLKKWYELYQVIKVLYKTTIPFSNQQETNFWIFI